MSYPSRLAAAALSLAGALSPCGAADRAPDRAAVPLHRPPVETPVETAGSGVAPEVTVEVKVDAGGRVASVEIEAIRPTSEFDELFAETCHKTLLRWRFAPPVVDGVPVEATLRWTVQFAALHEEQERNTYWWRPARRRDSADETRRKILAMPAEQRLKYFSKVASKADSFLDAGRTRRFSSDRFVVLTDAIQPEMAEKLARNLEATFNVLGEMFDDRIPPQSEPYKIRAYLFASQISYENFQSQIEGWERSAGFYHPTGLLAFHQQVESGERLVAVMLHEATHAYLDRYVVRGGVSVPRWLHEGLAEYMENSTIEKGRLMPGKTRRSVIRRSPYGSWRGKSSSWLGLADIKKALDNDAVPALEELVGSGADELFRDEIGMAYGLSWVAVHFLHHGEPEWAEQRFPAFLLYVAEGYPAAAALREVYGFDWAEANAAFRKYVGAM